MGEIKTGYVHAAFEQFSEDIGVGGGWPDGADDFATSDTTFILLEVSHTVYFGKGCGFLFHKNFRIGKVARSRAPIFRSPNYQIRSLY
jgi:hypothetical protein